MKFQGGIWDFDNFDVSHFWNILLAHVSAFAWEGDFFWCGEIVVCFVVIRCLCVILQVFHRHLFRFERLPDQCICFVVLMSQGFKRRLSPFRASTMCVRVCVQGVPVCVQVGSLWRYSLAQGYVVPLGLPPARAADHHFMWGAVYEDSQVPRSAGGNTVVLISSLAQSNFAFSEDRVSFLTVKFLRCFEEACRRSFFAFHVPRQLQVLSL